MKKLIILFTFLLTSFAFGQFSEVYVVGDTTDLKTYEGSGIVLLEQYGGTTPDVTGGGLFHRIDSTYSEGSYAFDHGVDGYQWARIGLIDPDPTLNSVTVTGQITHQGAFQQSVSSASGYSYNLISLTSAGSGANLRGWRVNLTTGASATTGDMQCVHGYLTMGTTPTINNNAAIYPLSAWLDIPNTATIGTSTVLAGIRVIFDPNNNDMGGNDGNESALFYGQTWASTGTIDAGILMSAGSGSTIESAFELGTGTFNTIMDFTSWGADNLMVLIEGGPKDAAALTHFHVYVGDSGTRSAINTEVGATALGSLYINTTGEIFVCTGVSTWQKVTTTASD